MIIISKMTLDKLK